jgi:hypothetical protein
MPRVPGAAVQWINSREPHGKFRRIGAADDDGPRTAKVTDQGRVLWCDDIGERGETVRGRLAFLVDIHLDGDGNPEKWSRLGKGLQPAISSGGFGECLGGEVHNDRVQPGVEPPNAFRDGGHDRGTREPAVADTRSHLNGA